MSDSIQSISQGNYILQGTVATSAGIVGDGSTQNPLRADETVLWSSATSPTLGQTITASEDFTNFDRIGLYFQGYKKVEYVVPYSTTGNWNIVKGAGVANCWLQICSISQKSSNTLALTAGKNLNFGTFTSTSNISTITATTGLGDGFNLIKVVGINRISANNA